MNPHTPRYLDRESKKYNSPREHVPLARIPSEYVSFLVKVALLGVLWGAWIILSQALEVIGLLVLAIFVSVLLSFPLRWLERIRIPRAVSVVILFVLLFLLVSGIGLLIIPVALEKLTTAVSRTTAFLGTLETNY
jgi:predicted PurR-regulated permease PerM